MLPHIVMDGLLLKAPLQQAKEIDRHQFLICQKRFGRIIAPALIFEFRVLIVDPANPQIESDELKFQFHGSTLRQFVGLLLYP